MRIFWRVKKSSLGFNIREISLSLLSITRDNNVKKNLPIRHQKNKFTKACNRGVPFVRQTTLDEKRVEYELP